MSSKDGWGDSRFEERGGISRRTVLFGGAAAAVTSGLKAQSAAEPLRRKQRSRIAVLGAGAFGGWTALHLLRAGAQVTLVDAWGPGNSRASSGGETRVIRGTYGPDRVYVEMVARSLELWRDHQERWSRPLFHQTGMLWMVGENDAYEKASLPLLREAGLRFEELTVAEASRRFPQVHFEGIHWAIHEHDAGYLLARRGCQAVLGGFLQEGGTYRQAAVTPPVPAGRGSALQRLPLSTGASLEADQYVFACGPWLGKLFPDALGDNIRPTRQEVFYFGTPRGDDRYLEDGFPAWIDNGERLFYGIPGSEWRGFKVADDTRGPDFDPTGGERIPTARGIQEARDYVAFRFPGLKDAPLLEARVCQYEQSPDGHFILDRHPTLENVWLVGGGSGHGYKHGPALGERVAKMVLGEEKPDPFFSIERLRGAA